jgi:hypothetical protein
MSPTPPMSLRERMSPQELMSLREPVSLRQHRPFLIALGLAAVARVLVQIAFPPGFVFSDGPTYLALVDHLQPLEERTVGYGFLLRGLAAVARDVWLITGVQHVLGLLTGVLIYVLLRRWDVSARLATLATLPVLFDPMQLSLEHSVLSDVAFDLLVVAGVAALAWHRAPRVSTALVGGLLLGTAVCVRVVGQPLVLAAVVFCLVAAVSWRDKVVTAVVVAAAFALPVTAYAAWYHSEHGTWALSESGGRALYMRTTGFVDCSQFTVPAYERPLCPAEPLGQRLDPTQYGWHMPDQTHGLHPPPGITPDQAMQDFAISAIRAQPFDYVRIVARDMAMNFMVPRIDRFEYDTASKWQFETYVNYHPTAWTLPAYAAHGGDMPHSRRPLADVIAIYGYVVYLWGPLLLALILVGVAGLVVRRPAGAARTRPLVLLALLVGVGLMAEPVVTAQFVWRYQLPALVLVPLAAAAAFARLRTPQSPTTATPSTDWPNGGVTRRSTNRVVGTTSRS